MGKRCLVTGGAGFIGSFLCEKLLLSGHDVLCVDNFFTGTKANVQHLMARQSFEIIRHDIIKPFNVEVDEIYNLACPASPVYYQLDAIRTTKINVIGALRMLELARRLKVKILQASTSEVYGDPAVHPQTEAYWGNVNPIGVRACYDEGKRCAESLFFNYRRQHGLKIKVVRIFNTYGPRMHVQDGRVVSHFIVNALKGDALTVYGSGRQTRSFCYVTDLVKGIMQMMRSSDDITGPVNLGNPHEITVLELAERIIELTGSRSKICFQELPEDDPAKRKPDISLAGEKLDWKPEVDLDTGLRLTIAYFEKKLVNEPDFLPE